MDRPGFHNPGRFIRMGFLTPNDFTVYSDDAVIVKDPIPCAAVFPMLTEVWRFSS
jgi:hypothetical protein